MEPIQPVSERLESGVILLIVLGVHVIKYFCKAFFNCDIARVG